MGEYQLVFTIIAVLILVVLLTGLVFALVATLSETIVKDKSSNRQIERVVKTHLVENCLKNGKEVIEKDFLENTKGKDLTNLCSFSFEGKISVVDLLTREKWDFGKGGVGENEIFVRIRDGDDIHIGRLHATL